MLPEIVVCRFDSHRAIICIVTAASTPGSGGSGSGFFLLYPDLAKMSNCQMMKNHDKYKDNI